MPISGSRHSRFHVVYPMYLLHFDVLQTMYTASPRVQIVQSVVIKNSRLSESRGLVTSNYLIAESFYICRRRTKSEGL